MALAATFIILAAALFYTAAPLFRKDEVDPFLEAGLQSHDDELFMRKESLEEALKELEYDLSTGKISEHDYDDLKEKYSKELSALPKI